MPIYKDNANNRRLKRVGKAYGKECQPCEVKKKKKVVILKKQNIKTGKTVKEYKLPKNKSKLKKLKEETKKLKSMM